MWLVTHWGRWNTQMTWMRFVLAPTGRQENELSPAFCLICEKLSSAESPCCVTVICVWTDQLNISLLDVNLASGCYTDMYVQIWRQCWEQNDVGGRFNLLCLLAIWIQGARKVETGSSLDARMQSAIWR